MSLLRQPLLALSRSAAVKKLATTLPVSSGIVARYVPGESTGQVLKTVANLQAAGLRTSVDHLGEDTLDLAQAEATVRAYEEVLAASANRGLAQLGEVSVKLTAIGLALDDGEQVALANARRICRAARNAGAQVTVDMEDHTATDVTLQIVKALRADFPDTGAVIQAYLHRSEDDCRALAEEGSRVRLCKGAYAEPADVAFTEPHQVDLAYVRCLKVLMKGAGYPMLATHDPRMIAVGAALARSAGRRRGQYEFQMLYGIRPEEQRRLVAEGETMRVYVPYGREWYGYLMRRLAERPQNLSLFVKSLVSKT
ncbi:proline dehydrogenase family protein [Nocardioides sp. Bht2]|uniref:proline dehydrogenase family protein n=1 Tax=Nocardioides sp. Bht2 TaxID=3392297 RepID=UPI0039B626ED